MMSFITKILKEKLLVGPLRVIPALIKFRLRKWLFYPMKGLFGLNVVTRKELFDNDSKKYRILQFGFEELIVVIN